MKKILMLIIFSFGISSMVSAQTIRRVNNTGITGTNIYSTLQAAHDAASNNDIIYLEPSATTYGSLSCTKKLTIAGPGYLQAENTVTGQATHTLTSYNKGSAIVDVITFAAGSTDTYLTSVVVNDHIDVLASGVTITRTYFATNNFTDAIRLGVITNCVISKCFLNGNYGKVTNYSGSVPSGIQVLNCIISDGVEKIINSTIEYCVIGSAYLSNLSNCTVRNNIFTNSSYQSWGLCYNCSYTDISYNALCSNATGLTNNNVGNISYSSLFANYYNTSLSTNPWSSRLDADFITKTGIAPLSSDGITPRGIFGSANPYVPAGLIMAPIITKFNSSASGNNTVPLQVVVSVRSNN